MTRTVVAMLKLVNTFFLGYLLIYATFLFACVVVGAWKLYYQKKMHQLKNEIYHQYYVPVSVLVPAYNEEVTIVESVESLLHLDYKLYEIIVIDDGSTDGTVEKLRKHFRMKKLTSPIYKQVPCKDMIEMYQAEGTRVKLTLVCKYNGGKGDSLNMGINVSAYPYLVCVDADSMLQRNSLTEIVKPVMENDKTVAVGGLIRVAQCILLRKGEVTGYQLPWNLLMSMQVMEYDRSFLASRILLDEFNGNLIISGAFGLFQKDIVIGAGGYHCNTLGEDMELVVRIHRFCRNNQIPYTMRYQPDAICWSQAPGSLKDLQKQRRRWHLGLFQSLVYHRDMCLKSRFGLTGSVSYLYYLFYELLSPVIELLGWCTMIVSSVYGVLNVPFMIHFYLLYAIYGAILSITAFFQRIYTQNLKVSHLDVMKAMVLCVVENLFFRVVMDVIRVTAFVGYRRRKGEWGLLKRVKNQEIS